MFIVAALGVPPFAFVLSQNKRWIRYAFVGIIVAMCMYINTSINFYSHEHYRGSARGMEVSLAHLMAWAVIGALMISGKFKKWVPETGYVLYIIYFLLCLPSMSSAEDKLIAWFEVWKMIMLYFFYVAVYSYMDATEDIKTVVKGLAIFAIVNMLTVVKDHLSGIYQPHGVFPHQNCMAVAMHLFGSMFFAAYLANGVRKPFGKLCFVAFAMAAAATARSYSRMALALMPVGYGIAFIFCVFVGKTKRWLSRIAPIAVMGMLAFAAILPRIIERFVNAPEASGNTRVELALCAWEMIKDEPWRGVGINNWGIKINPPYEYAELAGRITNRGEDFRDGIVETVYLLVAAECGLPALAAMLAWYLWHLYSCIRLVPRLKGTKWMFIPAGLAGGLTIAYLQSCMEWVFRQQLNLICLMFFFALISYLNKNWRRLRIEEGLPVEPEKIRLVRHMRPLQRLIDRAHGRARRMLRAGG